MRNRIKKIKYWLEENVLSNIYSTIIFLLLCTFIFVGIVTIIMLWIELSFKAGKYKPFEYYCDNLFTAINAWYPEIPNEESLITWKSYFLKVLVALFGIFFTSIVIGFISEKISSIFYNIKSRNRKVFENNHIIILGYNFGECKVIEEVILSTSNKIVIIVADNHNKSDIYEDIKEHLNIPKNVKIIVQSIDITDYNILEYCSIENSKVVIINTIDDDKIIKSTLAVSHIINKYNKNNIKVISAVKNEKSILPYNKQKDIVTMINAKKFIAKILAKTINQKLIYYSLLQLLSFDGVEFYLQQFDDFIGKKYEYVLNSFSNAIPVGVLNDGKFYLILEKDYVIKNDDYIVYIAREKNSYKIVQNEDSCICENLLTYNDNRNEKIKVFLIGYYDNYDVLLEGLIADEIYVIGRYENEHNLINEKIKKYRNVKLIDYNPLERNYLEKIVLANKFNEIVVLANNITKEENDDINTMIMALHLRDIKRINGLDFHMIVTLNDDKNRELLDIDKFQSIIVASNIVHTFLVQLALNYKLKPFFIDILSDNGTTIDIIKLDDICKIKSVDVGSLRRTLFIKKYIYIGHIDKNNGTVIFDLNVKDKIALNKDIVFLVIKLSS